MLSLDVFREIKPWKKPLHAARAYLAKLYLKSLPNVQVIGVTGSVGKTLTQNAIASVLSQKYKVVVGDENLDPTFRIPQTILKARPWHKFIVLEYGVEHPGDMDYYLWLVKPKFAIVTNVAPTHIKYVKSERGVFQEEVKLVKSLSQAGTAVLNVDDPMVVKMKAETKGGIFWFGRGSKSATKISQFSQNLNGSTFRLHYQADTLVVSWNIVGKHQILSALAATSMGIIAGLTLKQIALGLSKVDAPRHRLSVIKTPKFNILDDTYNSSPKAAKESIETLVDLGASYQKIAVLGEMKDLGSLSQSEHSKLGKFISGTNINYLITIGKVAGIIGISTRSGNFKGKVFSFSTTLQALEKIKKVATKNSLILTKGSRHAHLERIVFALQGKSTQISCYHCGNLK